MLNASHTLEVEHNIHAICLIIIKISFPNCGLSTTQLLAQSHFQVNDYSFNLLYYKYIATDQSSSSLQYVLRWVIIYVFAY